ncbi:MAG: type II secretion system secretin GspD [Thermodesulfobacteriota bacterium]
MIKPNDASQKTGSFLFLLLFTVTAILSASLPLSVFSQVSPVAPAEGPNKVNQGEKEQNVSIDFNNVDLPVFIKFISQLTGKNFVVDERVKGKVSIFSPGKISLKEAMAVFESVLEVHGYSTVSAGEIIKVVPSTDVRTKSIETKLKEDIASPDDRVVTQIIPLRYADPEEIKRLLSPLISKNSVLLSYPPTSTLIITDVHSNIKRLLQIINAVDITGIGREISVIPLRYSYAEKLVKTVESVFKTPPGPQKLSMERDVKLVADERTNSIIILASENDSIKIKNLIELLDKEVPKGKEKIHVYYLENAVAEEIAKVLQEIPEKEEKPDPAKPLLQRKSPGVSDKVAITPDKATNSLIIRGDIDDFTALVEIIQKLDIPRSMVFIECLIMEVNVEKDFELGTEWSVFGGRLDDDGTFRGGGGGFGGGGFNKIPPLDPDTGIPTKPFPPGFTLGIFETIKIGNIYFPNIAALINAYKKEKDVHILSTPQILTTDNQEAKITIGKNIPYQTKEGTTSANETYSTYEYKDVGITLKITPHISKERLVRLNISEEISKLESSTDFRPTTLKRTIDTTVIVRDKNTVVIGGLIDQAFSKTEYRIPCLGDIPVAGWIFRNMAKENEKTNLFIFLTPHVVNSPTEAEQILNQKKGEFPRIEEGKINSTIPKGFK